MAHVGKVGDDETPDTFPEDEICLCIHGFGQIGLQNVLSSNPLFSLYQKRHQDSMLTVCMIPVDATKQK